MRKSTLSIIVLGVLGILLTGCGGSGAGSMATAAQAGVTASPMSGGIEDASSVRGPSSAVNATTKTFTVKAQSGTFALNTLVKVTTNLNTRYRDANGNNIGANSFFSQLTLGKRVEVEGKASGTSLLAAKAKIERS